LVESLISLGNSCSPPVSQNNDPRDRQDFDSQSSAALSRWKRVHFDIARLKITYWGDFFPFQSDVFETDELDVNFEDGTGLSIYLFLNGGPGNFE